jgi:sigma-B regulation protein RsbU (phosphoserine phosphatase)
MGTKVVNTDITVLIADDDACSRILAKNCLVEWGYTVLAAVDGKHARELLRAHRVDICIFDWDMPGMTGIELCKWLRSTQLDALPYIILLTSRDSLEDLRAGYEAGADDYITKPLNREYLLQRLVASGEKLLFRRALRQQTAAFDSDHPSVALQNPVFRLWK